MENASIWLQGLKSGLIEITAGLIDFLPNLAAAVALLVIGWYVGKMARVFAVKITNGVNRLMDGVVATGRLATVRISANVAELIGTIAFWLVVFVFATAAADVAELTVFSVWLESIVAYLPNLLGGGLIIFIGYLVSVAVRDLSMSALNTLSVRQGNIIGATLQWATFLIAFIIGIEQIGIDVTFLIVVIAIIAGSMFSGLALAFGFGAKPLKTNLMGAHFLRQHYIIGQPLRIGGVEGKVLEFTTTGLTLATAEGITAVPGAAYFDDVIILMNEDDDHD
jgi:hypothetical protein